MSKDSPQRQTQALLKVCLAALCVWGVLALHTIATGPGGPAMAKEVESPLLTDFERQRGNISSIRFTLVDDSFTLTRRRNGWVIPEAGDFPVSPDRLGALMIGLASLKRGDPRTSDPEKLALLGLGDPNLGGNGVRLDLIGADDGTTTSFILGRRPTGLYARSPDRSQAFRLKGDLPSFYTRRSWLDVDFLTIAPDALEAVRLYDGDGRTAYFRREAGDPPDAYRPAPPHMSDQVRNRFALSETALAISGVSFLDARPAGDLVTEPVARHISETFDDLEIELQAHREPDGLWVTLHAREAGDGARRAAFLNARATGWAFRVSSLDFNALTPTVSDLVNRPATP